MRHPANCRIATFLGALGLILAALPSATAEEGGGRRGAVPQAEPTANRLCPVTGRPVAENVAPFRYRDERIGFCRAECRAAFRAEPATFMDRMRQDPRRFRYRSIHPSAADLSRAASAAGSANGLCPVMQKPVTVTGGAVVWKRQRIAFCCPGCIQKFRRAPERAMRAMRADPGAYGYARPGPSPTELHEARVAAGSVNGLCPVMRKPVTPDGGAVSVAGERVAFCCPGCIEKFRENAEAYLRAMRAEPHVYGYVPPRRRANTPRPGEDGRE